MITTSATTIAVSIWLIASFLLLACGAIRLVDGGPTWLLFLTLGALVSTLAHIALIIHPDTALADGTMASIMTLYVFPLGLAWFALPAMMMFRDGSHMSETQLWAMTGALTLGLILWIGPLLHAGHMGQPFRYVDYPVAFATPNMAASIAVVAFGALMLAVVVFVRRTRS